MTLVDLVRRASDAETASQLLTAIGIQARPNTVALDVLAAAGIDVHGPVRRLTHLATRRNCYFYFADVEERRTAREVAASLASLNPIARVVLLARNGSQMDLVSRCGGIQRRLALDPDAPLETSRALESIAGNIENLDATFESMLDPSETGRRFFHRFRDGVARLRRHLDSQDLGTKADELPLLLLSRVLFLHFIQEKGWLDGDRNYIAARSEIAKKRGEVFRHFFVPLFFGCLNTPAKNRFVAARGLGRIPYLNGGLFEPSLFEREHGPLSIPNEVWSEVTESIFDSTRFTASEDDGSVREIDPEMLGRIFESLMASEERLQSGSFYTPRQVVDRIVENAVFERFSAELPALRARTVAELAQQRRPRGDVEKIAALAAGLRVLDPACGSGAFLLGALRILERIQTWCASALEQPLPADLRSSIVSRNLFGVDLKRDAVRLCELRLWLAIVAPLECPIEEVPTLPNLDRNVMQGNSLIDPIDLHGDVSATVHRKWSTAVARNGELVSRYRNADSRTRAAILPAILEGDRRLADAILNEQLTRLKSDYEVLSSRTRLFEDTGRPLRIEDLSERIASLEKQISRLHAGDIGFFSFDVHFSHVLAEGGFDVVVGNPPWVRRQRIDPLERAVLDRRFRTFGARSFDQSDLSVAFLERSATLVRQRGIVAMLVPSKIATANYAGPIRKLIIEEAALRAVTDFSAQNIPIFDADTFPLAITFAKAPPATVHVEKGTDRWEGKSTEIAIDAEPASAWHVGDPAITELRRNLAAKFSPLRVAFRREPLMGVKTGSNDRFFFDRIEIRGEYGVVPATGIRIPLANLARCVRGRDVDEFEARSSVWLLLPPVRSLKPPLWFCRYAESIGVAPETLQLSYLRAEHLGLKVAWKDLSRGIRAAVIDAEESTPTARVALVPNQTLYFIDSSSMKEARAITAFFNSAIFRALALIGSEAAKDRHQRYYASHVGRIPAPDLELDRSEWEELSILGRRPHTAGAREAIDSIVRKLYTITVRDAARLHRYAASMLG